jgi:hypothetical protein
MKKLLICAAIFSIAAFSLPGCSKERKEKGQNDELFEENVEIEDLNAEPYQTQNINTNPIRQNPQQINTSPLRQTPQPLNTNRITHPVKEYNSEPNRIPNSNQR